MTLECGSLRDGYKPEIIPSMMCTCTKWMYIQIVFMIKFHKYPLIMIMYQYQFSRCY